MTQAELAGILNYSDKAISKWERGESLPDVTVLKQIAQVFGVSLDYLTSEHGDEEMPAGTGDRWMSRNHLIITGLSIIGVWFIATLVFVCGYAAGKNLWIAFPTAVPVSLIVLLVLNTLWGKLRYDLYIISALIWTVLGVLYLSLLKYNFWLVFAIGIPLQLAAILSFTFKRTK
jgi:transcriptional regulator with XRE-family HTH domain